MRRELRQSRLRIKGEPTVTIDYRGMFAMLAYAHVGVDPPSCDPYSLPGLEPWRKGIKLLATAALFRDGRMTRAPRNTREHLPPRVSVRELMGRIKEHHPAIAHLLETQIGHKLMHDESEVLVAVLLRLRDLGITGLPIHDAIVAPVSAKEIVKRVMVEVYRTKVGSSVEVEEQNA